MEVGELARFKLGERVRMGTDPDTPRDLWGHMGSVEYVKESELGDMYSMRLDLTVRGRQVYRAIPEEWLEGGH